MSTPTPCPNRQRLQALLSDRLPGGEQERVTEHLSACPACQQSLEELATGNSSWVEVVRQAGTASRPAPDSAYWQAVTRLEDPTTPVAGTPSETLPSGLLSAPERPGTLGQLGHFDIVRVIGRGGMGVVLHAFDTHLERDVALKVLDPQLAGDEVARQRFCRESRSAASVTHDHVVAVHHVAHEEGTDLPYLVMQLIDGEPLDERLRQQGKLPVEEVVRIGMQTAAGLAAAHEKGLTHRDVKPGNILLERGSGGVKLTDFGLARAADDIRLTRTGLVAGTPLYMAPEQARGEEIDGRADLFSLGVVLYELCTGEPPFDGPTPLAVLKRLTEEHHRPVRELNPEVPEWLAAVIDRLLAKSPADRFQSAREVADLLQGYWAAIKSSTAVATCPVQKRRKAVRRRLAGLVLAALAGAVLATGAMLFWPRLTGRGGKGRHEAPLGESPAPEAVLKGNSGSVWSVAFAPDDNVLVMGIEDGTVKLWDLPGRQVQATLGGHRAAVWATVYSPDGQILATGSDDGTVLLRDVSSRKVLHSLEHPASVRAVVFLPDGKSLLTGDRQGGVRRWDVQTGKELAKWAHTGAVYALALAPDSKTVAAAGSDKVVKLWDLESGQERLTLTGHTGPVYSLAFGPRGQVLASASWDHTIRLWDAGSGDLLRQLKGHDQDVWSVCFSPDGKTLASAGTDGTVRLWDTASGAEWTALRGHTGTAHCVAFSRSGDLLASGGRDGTVQLWRVEGR